MFLPEARWGQLHNGLQNQSDTQSCVAPGLSSWAVAKRSSTARPWGTEAFWTEGQKPDFVHRHGTSRPVPQSLDLGHFASPEPLTREGTGGPAEDKPSLPVRVHAERSSFKFCAGGSRSLASDRARGKGETP